MVRSEGKWHYQVLDMICPRAKDMMCHEFGHDVFSFRDMMCPREKDMRCPDFILFFLRGGGGGCMRCLMKTT